MKRRHWLAGTGTKIGRALADELIAAPYLPKLAHEVLAELLDRRTVHMCEVLAHAQMAEADVEQERDDMASAFWGRIFTLAHAAYHTPGNA